LGQIKAPEGSAMLPEIYMLQAEAERREIGDVNPVL
jgi:hypothetical protein